MPLTIAAAVPAADVVKKGMDVAITKIKAGSEVRVAQLELASKVFDTIGKGIEYLRAREEWRSRVEIARQGVAKALVDLENARGDQANRAEELRQLGVVRRQLGTLIEQFMADLDDASIAEAERQAIRRDAVQLASQLASVGK